MEKLSCEDPIAARVLGNTPRLGSLELRSVAPELKLLKRKSVNAELTLSTLPMKPRKRLAHRPSRADLASRCSNKSRYGVYDSTHGINCHLCRQKKLCGEKDCMRCSNLNNSLKCIGKTECSECHSSRGVFCKACLRVRYGEEMEEVRANKQWMCPHCIEEKGINPYWICNSSVCLRRRKMKPTGIAIHKAIQKGHSSVAHLIMEELRMESEKAKTNLV